MSFSGFIGRYYVALAVVVAAVVGSRAVYAQGDAGKAGASGLGSTIVVSNWSELNPKKSTYKQMKEDLFKPFQSMNPNGSMDAVIPLPSMQQQNQSRQGAADKRAQDWLDKRRNWAFTDMNELFPQANPLEDSLGTQSSTPANKQNQSLSPVEKYYESLGLGRKNSLTDEQKAGRADTFGISSDINRTNEYNPLGVVIPGVDGLMKNAGLAGSSGLPEQNVATFAPPATLLTPEQRREEKERRDEFQRILDPRAPVSAAAGLSGSLRDAWGQPTVNRAADPANYITHQVSEQPFRSALAPMLGTMDPTARALHSSLLDDPTARALGLPNPAPYKPVVAPPKTALTVQEELDPFRGIQQPRKF
ncbi:MAG: hypothetical protein JWR26_2420 [Pedosphaera sp.]|nr:hypothetical protein [Pedosphaera sp.]